MATIAQIGLTLNVWAKWRVRFKMGPVFGDFGIAAAKIPWSVDGRAGGAAGRGYGSEGVGAHKERPYRGLTVKVGAAG